ncbi:MAG: hypothetical protein OXH45_00870 [Gammaproteobacteria bacterium]|nr:hypothetical protein [Gammaproteobacteria bacterium]
MTRVVCWNIAGNRAPWNELFQMDADVALLQEVKAIPKQLPEDVDLDPGGFGESWEKDLYDRWPMVVKLSNRVEVEWFRRVLPISEPEANEVSVSGIGTIAAAQVLPKEGEAFIAISMYARWIRPHVSTRSSWRVGYADGSAHRIISDLSAFIGHSNPGRHRILAAGDLNTMFGITDENPLCDPLRDQTIFDRMIALGLEFMGPEYPNGRQAETPIKGQPEDSKSVPTYRTVRQRSPKNANTQLDYVFASRGFHKTIRTRALNEVDEWGPSDHCRLLIEID